MLSFSLFFFCSSLQEGVSCGGKVAACLQEGFSCGEKVAARLQEGLSV
jgi:hypothetical protein